MIVYGLFGVALAYTIYSLILFSYYLFTIKIVLKVNLSLPISSILKIIFNILPILFLGFICTSLSDNIYVRMITIILSLIIYIVISFYNSPLYDKQIDLEEFSIGWLEAALKSCILNRVCPIQRNSLTEYSPEPLGPRWDKHCKAVSRSSEGTVRLNKPITPHMIHL